MASLRGFLDPDTSICPQEGGALINRQASEREVFTAFYTGKEGYVKVCRRHRRRRMADARACPSLREFRSWIAFSFRKKGERAKIHQRILYAVVRAEL